MAYALVGSVGAVSATTGATMPTPAFGTGESRTAGNLLVCFIVVIPSSSNSSFAVPSGWTAAYNVGWSFSANGIGVSLFYRIATGGDAAPTLTSAGGGGDYFAMLGEFSGNATSSPLDQQNTLAGGVVNTTQTVTLPAADAAPGELVIYTMGAGYSSSHTETNSVALNNGATSNDTNNNSTSSTDHYNMGWGITTGNSSADVSTFTVSTTKLFNTELGLASFKLPPVAPPPVGPFPVYLPRSLGPRAVGPTYFARNPLPTPINAGRYQKTFTAGGISNDAITSGQILAWYDAAAITGVSNGASLSQWNDRSGNGFNATQGTGANQPTYNTNQQNGLPAVSFNGSQWVVATTMPTDGQPFTVFAAVDASGAGGNHGICGAGGNGLYTNFTSVSFYAINTPNTVAPAGWHYVTAVGNGTSSIIRVDGVQGAVGNAGSSSFINTGFNIGSLSSGGSNPWTTPLGEVIICLGALSITDMQAFEQYLSDKWLAGVTSTGGGVTWGWTGALDKATTRTLPAAGLSFTGSLPNRVIGKLFNPVLSFTGSIPVRTITRPLAAGLSFTGNVFKAATRTLVTAVLSFTGSFTRGRIKILTAGLSFTGSSPTRAITRSLIASLSFTGSVIRATSRALPGGLSFTGTLQRATARPLSAGLSFTGTGPLRAVIRPLVAGLSFTGGLLRSTARTLTGGLSFTGRTTKTTTRTISGGANFSGGVTKSTARTLASGLSFTGGITRAVARRLVAGLSFTGIVNTRQVHTSTGPPPMRYPTTATLGGYVSKMALGGVSTIAALGQRVTSAIAGLYSSSETVGQRTTSETLGKYTSQEALGERSTTETLGEYASNETLGDEATTTSPWIEE